MIEFEIQQRFYDFISGREPLPGAPRNQIRIYRELVFYRFFEVISNALPLFASRVPDNQFREMVVSFIQHKPKTLLIWQMPREFIEFVQDRDLVRDFPWAEDLLWYEWIEIELLMETSKTETVEFNWKSRWTLSTSARQRKMKYKIYDNDFKKRGDYPVLLYYHFGDDKAHFQEITPFLFRLLELMAGHEAEKALEMVCAEFQIDSAQAFGILDETMQSFCGKKILVPV